MARRNYVRTGFNVSKSNIVIPNHSGISNHVEAVGNFLKLNCSNDPLTGDLEISKATPKLSLTDSTSSETAYASKESTSGELKVVNSVLKPAQANSAIKLNGTDEYFTLATAGYRSGDSQGTISAWWKPDDVTVTSHIWGSNDVATNDRFWAFAVNTDGQITHTSKNGGTQDAIKGDTVMTNGNWYHLVLTSDGSTWKMYVNGVLQNITITLGSNTGNWLADITGRDNVNIGALKRTVISGYAKGTIDEIALYNTELTQAEILALYNSGTGYHHLGTETGLVGLWHLNDNIGIVATEEISGVDLSGVNTDDTNWVTGKVVPPAVNVDATIISSTDGTVTNEEGAVTFGHSAGLTKLQGTSIQCQSPFVLVDSAPSSATDTGIKGQIAFDGSYFYVCTATNTWERVAIATWV